MPHTPIRRTKIVATLGPAWDRPEQMTALLDAGVDVVRINASHGTPEIRARWIEQLRGVTGGGARQWECCWISKDPASGSARCRRHCGLLRERSSPSLPRPRPRSGEIPTTYDDLASDVRVGARILLDDGLLALEVVGISGHRVRARVDYGGELRANKGMNLPGIEVSAPALTEKDLEDVQRAVEWGVDYIALSFVRRPEDIEQLRALVPRWHEADRED